MKLASSLILLHRIVQQVALDVSEEFKLHEGWCHLPMEFKMAFGRCDSPEGSCVVL